MDENQAAEAKVGARELWAAGDFDAIARLIWGVGPKLVEGVGVGAGQDVLDIAAGTGNAAIPAAETGAAVVASDLTPELFAAGRRNAEAAGVEIDWVEADAEALPFDDESFDIVLSTFGIMFAPRHEVAAAEAARVLRPGGRIGLCCWTPEGKIGSFFKTIAGHTPPPPEDFVPPIAWGTREHVEDLFAGSGIRFEFSQGVAEFEFDSAEQALELYASKFGPMMMAKASLEPEGKWQALADDMIALFAAESTAGEDRGISYPGEYLTIIGSKGG